MKKLLLSIAILAVFAGCSLISPYSITFTTPDGSIVNPETDSLDLAVSMPTLAYISEIQCDEKDPMELLPVVTDEMEITKAHNLSLDVLANQERGAKCELTVTVFDQTTTANSRDSITLHVYEKLVEEEETVEEEEEVVEEEVVEEEVVEEEVVEEEVVEEEVVEEEVIEEEEATEVVEETSEEEAAATEETTNEETSTDTSTEE